MINSNQIKVDKNYLTITCSTARQANMLKQISTLDGIEVAVSSIPSVQSFELIIHGNFAELDDNDILSDSSASRLMRLGRSDLTRASTNSLVLTFLDQPPEVVTIGFKAYKDKAFYRKPTRCNKCQMFGHPSKVCKKTTHCPLCSQNHTYAECNTNRVDNRLDGANLKCISYQGPHSSAYRNCPKFISALESIRFNTNLKFLKLSNCNIPLDVYYQS